MLAPAFNCIHNSPPKPPLNWTVRKGAQSVYRYAQVRFSKDHLISDKPQPRE